MSEIELLAILAELRGNQARIISELHDIRSLLDPDTTRLQALLPKIAAVVGTLSFVLGDLEGEVDFDGLSSKQVGKLLQRNAGRVVAGYRVEQMRITREGREWRLTTVPAAP